MVLHHEVPTHLNVEDTLLGPLTPRQLVRLAAGLSLAYITWDQLTVVRQFNPAGGGAK